MNPKSNCCRRERAFCGSIFVAAIVFLTLLDQLSLGGYVAIDLYPLNPPSNFRDAGAQFTP